MRRVKKERKEISAIGGGEQAEVIERKEGDNEESKGTGCGERLKGDRGGGWQSQGDIIREQVPQESQGEVDPMAWEDKGEGEASQEAPPSQDRGKGMRTFNEGGDGEIGEPPTDSQAAKMEVMGSSQWWLDDDFLDWNVTGGEEETLQDFGDRLGPLPEDWEEMDYTMETQQTTAENPGVETKNQQPTRELTEAEKWQACLEEEKEILRSAVPTNVQWFPEGEEEWGEGMWAEGEEQYPGAIVGIRLTQEAREVLGNRAADIEAWKFPRWQTVEVLQVVTNLCGAQEALQDTLAKAKEQADLHEAHARICRRDEEPIPSCRKRTRSSLGEPAAAQRRRRLVVESSEEEMDEEIEMEEDGASDPDWDMSTD